MQFERLNQLPPTRIRRGRAVLTCVGASIFVMLVLIAVWERGIPWGVDFAKYPDGVDPFASSVRCVVWWCLVINLMLVCALWLRLPRWIGAASSSAAPPPAQLDGFNSRGAIFASSLLAIGLLVAIDAPRLSESLWNDEIWSMRESIHGSWQRELAAVDPSEALRVLYWDPLGWEHAVWRYETTNHHYLLNILAKGGVGIWQTATGAEEWEFDETALRILPFLCALAGIGAWSLFFSRLGFGSAAMIVPWMLALHPWYQQHATGMRGYALVFLFLPLTLLATLAALRCGRWRSWIGYALAQFLFIYSWPGGAMVMVAFNSCLAVVVWRRWTCKHERSDQMKRWAIANLASLMILLPLVAPGIYQIGPYLQEEVMRHPMGLPWLRNLACFLFSGCPWPDVDGYSLRSGHHVTGEWLWRKHPIIFPSIAVTLLGSLVFGVVSMWRRAPHVAGLLIFGLFLGPALIYFKATVATPGEDVFLYQWYFIYALPFLCGVTAIGISAGATRLVQFSAGGAWPQRIAPACIVGGILAAYAVLVFPRTLAMRKSSLEPRRESVHAMRGDLPLTDSAHAGFLTAHIFRSALIYDPFGWPVKTASNDDLPEGSPPGLTQLMRIADTRDLTLYVNVGLPSEARKEHPDAMELIDDSGFFDLHSQHFGLEPQFERAVYKYRGGLFKFDFSRLKP